MSAGVPQTRRVREPAVQADAVAILLEPPAQRRPPADEDLVRDLRCSLAERQQAGGGEPVKQGFDRIT